MTDWLKRSGMLVGSAIVSAALAATVLAGPGFGRSGATQVLHAVDRGLCPFTLDVEVKRAVRTSRVGGATIRTVGPTAITLRNVSTGRTARFGVSGLSTLAPATGDLRFRGHQVWLATNHVPFLTSQGRGSKLAPDFVLVAGDFRKRVIDPCALVADAPPSTDPVTTPAPWGLPAFALSQMAYAGLTPPIGAPIRHDHVHLDVIVEGREVTVPAGVGQAEPVDVGPGPCPAPPESLAIGDCAPGHYFMAKVAASPLQTHTTSGIVHLQSDRPGMFRLGQFFDVWGVRFDSSCLGGHCAGGGKELRVYVDGKRVSGDPRRLVLRDRQQIAVVYGGPDDFGAVPAEYGKRWPFGCGGPGERSCFPGRG